MSAPGLSLLGLAHIRVELKGIFALFVLRSAFSAFDFDHEQTNIRYMYRN